MNLKKGFTIIELIVVIAIIAVLAAIVMINVVVYINKSKDAAVIGNMNTLVKGAAAAYDQNLAANGTAYLATPAAVAAYSAIETNSVATTAFKNGGSSTDQSWCVQAELVANTGTYECADNTGFIGVPTDHTKCHGTGTTCN